MPKPRKIALETPTARAKLTPRKPSYFVRIAPHIALGYRRNASGFGAWSVRYRRWQPERLAEESSAPPTIWSPPTTSTCSTTIRRWCRRASWRAVRRTPTPRLRRPASRRSLSPKRWTPMSAI